MADAALQQDVEAVRRFNRFYTKRIGALREGLLDTPFSLSEARVVYELGRAGETTAGDMARQLALDPGYLSRMLQGFQRRGLIARHRSESDGRRALIRLTKAGERAFALLDARAVADVENMLDRLRPEARARLVRSMRGIESILDPAPAAATPYLLRPPEAGDLGWVVQRHGALYAEEYGWDRTFEALVAGIVAEFVASFDAAKERCWIAEMDGEPIGSVFLVKASDTTARLRLLLVEPRARGRGIGARLVDECVRAAPRMGYEKITLWTNDGLAAARHIYERAGFALVEEAPHRSFGHDLVGQTWERALH